GNLASHSFSGGVGLVSSRLTLEGPVVKNKLSYIVGGRISYSDWLVRQIKDVQLKNSEAEFHDLTGKIFFHPDKNNMVSLSGYYSYDDFKLGNDSIFSWNTMNLSLKWDHIFNETFSGLFIVASSNYESHVNFEEETESFYYRNSINNLLLKYNLLYSPAERLSVSFGLEGSGSVIEPGEIDPTTRPTNVIARDVGDQRAIETAVFFQSSYDIFEDLGLSLGLRYSHFFRLGPGDIYQFDYDNLDGRYPSITDTVSHSSGDLISEFGGLEPRVSLRYGFNENSSIKASYYRTIQYTHLISNTITPSPLDFWIASGPWVEPVTSDQYSFGLFRNFRNNKYEISAEAYYKKMIHVVDYIEGADLVLNESLERGLTQGPGRAYGVELQVNRNEEKLKGWVSYTWSRSLRKFESEVPILNINSGEYYPSQYDQPHDLSFVANYRIWERSVISVNFNYKTGRPITIPVSKFGFGPVLSVLNYSGRNEYRMPDYHRLDLTITLEDKIKRNKRFRGEWVLSIYNVYGRKNAYSIYFDEYGMAHKVSILGSIFPSISYNFKY
ncbi:MAG: TonB-dependent receptor, partial [Cyclobacteriaceae bacterium]|nr:TonB-dependent receptor [Cyclobacteriaceae bacterium]